MNASSNASVGGSYGSQPVSAQARVGGGAKLSRPSLQALGERATAEAKALVNAQTSSLLSILSGIGTM